MLKEFLAGEMETRQWTRADLATNAGVAESTIYRLLDGAVPELSTLNKLAQALNVPIRTLLDLVTPALTFRDTLNAEATKQKSDWSQPHANQPSEKPWPVEPEAVDQLSVTPEVTDHG